ncbi:MAG: hypothetical protein Kapaf2KO_09520 [Candidatus Kapaibacteriales bacterium]
MGFGYSDSYQDSLDIEQSETTDTINDSIPVDTLNTQIDSTTKDVEKKIELYKYPNEHFHLGTVTKPNKEISKRDLGFNSYGDIYELLSTTNDLTYQNSGIWAIKSAVRFAGGNPQNISYGLNGQTIGLDNGVVNPAFLSPDQIETLEIYTGTKASILGNGSETHVNFAQAHFNTANPYTRISYFDAGESMVSGDGVFSQNILPNQNLTFGFKGYGGGSEYDNHNADNFNINLGYRVLLDSTSVVSAQYYYSNQYMNENNGLLIDATGGGLNADLRNPYTFATLLTPEGSEVNREGFGNRNLNHIGQVSYSKSLFSDSTVDFYSSLMFNHSKYEQNDRTDSILDLNQQNYNLVQSDSYLRLPLEFFELSIGTQLMFATYEQIYSNAILDESSLFDIQPYGLLKLPLGNFEIGGGLRVNNLENLKLNFGGYIDYIDTANQLNGGLDISYTNLNNRLNFSLDNERNVFSIIADIGYGFDWLEFSLEGYYKIYNGYLQQDPNNNLTPSVIYDDGQQTVIGATLVADSKIFPGFLYKNNDLWLRLSNRIETISGVTDPIFEARGDIVSRFFVSSSIAEIGVRTRFFYNHTPFIFDAISRRYGIMSIEPVPLFAFSPFLMAQLGNANVRLIFENVLSERYFTQLTGVSRGSNLRIHLNWAFPFN